MSTRLEWLKGNVPAQRFFKLGLVLFAVIFAGIGGYIIVQSYAASTAELYVSPTGSDSNSGSASAPFATIQKAASVVTAGTTVHVAPGTYTGAVVNNQSGTATAPIIFISDTTWGAKIVGTGGLSGWPFRNNASYVQIIGFDMTSSSASDGIDLFGSYNLVKGNHVHNMTGMACNGSPGGSGIGDDSGSNNTYDGNVVNNIGTYPGQCDYIHGLYVDDAGDIVENNIAYNNAGNGIYVNHETGPVTFINNLSFANGEYGFGVNGTQSVNGFTIANNISMGNGIAGFKTWSIITGAKYINNISYNNPTNFIQDGGGTDQGTIYADPQFINYQTNGSGDYHLKSTSPAINAGVSNGAPATDYDGTARPQGSGYDIGPYEYAVAIPGDCSGDGHVNIFDLSTLLTYYGKSYPACDFHHDGYVSVTDLSIVLSNYGT